MINILAFRIVGVKTNYSTKEIVWGVFFEKGGCTCTRGTTPPGYGLEQPQQTKDVHLGRKVK